MKFKSYEDISVLSELQDIDPSEDGRGVTWCALTAPDGPDTVDENASQGDALSEFIQSNRE
jgi:mannose-6-phosphate isomerase class I